MNINLLIYATVGLALAAIVLLIRPSRRTWCRRFTQSPCRSVAWSYGAAPSPCCCAPRSCFMEGDDHDHIHRIILAFSALLFAAVLFEIPLPWRDGLFCYAVIYLVTFGAMCLVNLDTRWRRSACSDYCGDFLEVEGGVCRRPAFTSEPRPAYDHAGC